MKKRLIISTLIVLLITSIFAIKSMAYTVSYVEVKDERMDGKLYTGTIVEIRTERGNLIKRETLKKFETNGDSNLYRNPSNEPDEVYTPVDDEDSSDSEVYTPVNNEDNSNLVEKPYTHSFSSYNQSNDDSYNESNYERSSSSTRPDFTNATRVRTVTKAARDTTGAAHSLNRIIGAMLTIVQVAGVFLALLIITIEIIKILSYGSKFDRLRKDENADAEELVKVRDKLVRMRKNIVIWIVISIIIFCASGVLQIVKSFKPIIYIYPEEDNTEVSVTLSNPERITSSYPEYKDGWNVIANKDGSLKEVGKDREYYALYWEGLIGEKEFKDGFVVKGEDTREFLEEKLEILGLTDREAEEFIVYWLPKLENNRYNLIRFLSIEELNEDMALNIDPKPDTLIRIQMQYKPLLFKTDIPEQKLDKVERKGYTVVEWGGSEVK